MKVLVPVKRVIDYNVKARVKSDQSGVDLGECRDVIAAYEDLHQLREEILFLRVPLGCGLRGVPIAAT